MSSLILYKLINRVNGHIFFCCSPETALEYRKKGFTVNASVKKYKYGGCN